MRKFFAFTVFLAYVSMIACKICIGAGETVSGRKVITSENGLTSTWIPGDDPETPLKLMMDYFPHEIQAGDTVYLRFTLKNISDKTLDFIWENFLYGVPDSVPVKLSISDGGNEYPLLPLYPSRVMSWIKQPPYVPMDPGEERVMYAIAHAIPAIEDLDMLFWSNVLKRAQDEGTLNNGKGVLLNICAEVWIQEKFTHSGVIAYNLRQELPISFRNNPEKTQFLEQCFRCIPEKERPEIRGPKSLCKEPSAEFFLKHKADQSFISNPETPWVSSEYLRFMVQVPRGVLPYERWREYEEKFRGSTLGDEIRMTRMLIQYRDTKDPAVLDELTEWLPNMNELQRGLMSGKIWSLLNLSPSREEWAELNPGQNQAKTIQHLESLPFRFFLPDNGILESLTIFAEHCNLSVQPKPEKSQHAETVSE